MGTLRATAVAPTLLLLAAGTGSAYARDPIPPDEIPASARAIAFDPMKSNCLACHYIEGGENPGDLGRPPLVAVGARFPDKQRLREQLWDPMVNNPGSRMPPFGRHRILTEDERDKVVEFICSL
jgi:sulfur-oxidizing protein SoxX